MANTELKFLEGNGSYISVNIEDMTPIDNNIILHNEDLLNRCIIINGFDSDSGKNFEIWLDKSTAIKFAKTVRTEINKIKEVQNGGK